MDDLMPNDGNVFNPEQNEDLQKELRAEEAMVKAGAPLLEHIVAFLDEQIAQTSDIDSIDTEADDLAVQLRVQRKLKDRLVAVKADLNNLMDAHLKR
jgi:putative heme iron utilization protein